MPVAPRAATPHPPSASTRLRSLATRLLLALVSAAVVLALMEATLRIVEAATPRSGTVTPRSETHAFGPRARGFSPGYAGRLTSRDFDVSIRTNAQGFRERDLDLEEVARLRPYVFLGDSYFFGWGVEQEERLSERFAALIAGTRWEAPVVNLSSPGWGTLDQVEVIERFAAPLRPRLIFVGFFVGNDFLDNIQPPPSNDETRRSFSLRRFLRGSALFNLAKNALWGLPRFRQMFNMLEIRNDRIALYETASSAFQERLYEPTFTALEHLRLVARSAQVPLCIVIVPDHLQVLQPDLFASYELERPQRLLRRRLEELELPHVDLLRALAQHPDPHRLFFSSDKHWTQAGHELAASLLASEVERLHHVIAHAGSASAEGQPAAAPPSGGSLEPDHCAAPLAGRASGIDSMAAITDLTPSET